MKALLPAAIVFFGLFVAVNSSFAQTWTQSGAPSLAWSAVASSANGSNLVAAAGDTVFLSTNSGVTWTSNNLAASSYVSISADGTKLAVLASSFSVYASTNSGLTWVTNTLQQAYELFSIASSADGSRLMALDFDQVYSYISTNFGVTWKNITAAPGTVIAASADGTKWICAAYNTTNFYLSTNFGNSWNKINGPTNKCLSLAVSADATKLIAGGSAGSIYTSTNSGGNWNQTASPATNWFSVAISANGTKMIGASRGTGIVGPVYTSSDAGLTWISNKVSNQIWGHEGVVCSADGGEFVAAGIGNIFTSQSILAPQLNSVSLSNGFIISWIIPSTNFILQQNSDLSTGNWVTLTNTPMLNLTNLQNQVVLSPTNNSGFFRLIAQ